MKRRSLLGFLLLNVIVTVAVVSGLLLAYNRFVPAPTARPMPPLILVVTSTPGSQPSAAPPANTIVVTATAAAISIANATPDINSGTAIATMAATPSRSVPSPATVAVTSNVTANSGGLSTALATSASTEAATASIIGCITYTVKSGDVAGTNAAQFGITLVQLYGANGLKPDPLLRIGQALIIPGAGCDTPTPTATSTIPATATTSLLASSTAVVAGTNLPNTNQITITQVVRPGDITAEGVALHNTSATDTIDLSGWTLNDGAGHSYTFPTFRLFPNGDLLINTRAGSNTPRVLFWGLSSAVWGTPGAQVLLKDASGAVQVTFTVSN